MSIDNGLVSVDDTDPKLQWEGSWFSTGDNDDDLGNAGPPFLRTLHGISSNGSLSLSFYGRAVRVWGSLIGPRNTSLGLDPDWRCILDGIDIGRAQDYPTGSISNYEFCGNTSLREGNHSLQLITSIQSNTLYVDQVQFQAVLSEDIESAWTEVRQRDGRIKYSAGWQEDDGGWRRWTYQSGASLTFEFTGTAVIWGGYTFSNSTLGGPGMGQYTVDGKEPPTSFVIPSRSGDFSNQPYFNISGLNPGPHRLQVTNAGSATSAALAFTYFYLQNSPANTPNTPNTTVSPGDAETGLIPAGNRDSGKIIGAAVGGSVGGVLLVALVIIALIIRRRRFNREQRLLTPVPTDFGTASTSPVPRILAAGPMDVASTSTGPASIVSSGPDIGARPTSTFPLPPPYSPHDSETLSSTPPISFESTRSPSAMFTQQLTLSTNYQRKRPQ